MKKGFNPEEEQQIQELVVEIYNQNYYFYQLDLSDDDPVMERKAIWLLKETFQNILELMKIYYRGTVSEDTLHKQLNYLALYFERFIHAEGDSIFESLGYFPLRDFLGDWYITHVSWSSPAATRTYIAAFNKLVAMLKAVDLISKTEMDSAKQVLQKNKEEWIDRVQRFHTDPYRYEEYCLEQPYNPKKG